MEADETVEMLEEIEALRRRLSELSEAMADCRARRLTQETLITRLREELRVERSTQGTGRRA